MRRPTAAGLCEQTSVRRSWKRCLGLLLVLGVAACENTQPQATSGVARAALQDAPVRLSDAAAAQTYPDSSLPRAFTRSGRYVYFAASTASSGEELWRTDGTSEGTLMLRDLCPGRCDAQLELLTDMDGILYFTAADGSPGRQLWRSDGTPEGTRCVRSGLANYGLDRNRYLYGLTPMNGVLYFAAAEFEDRTTTPYVVDVELWRSDGTPGGTYRVKDLEPGERGSYPRGLFAWNGALYLGTAHPDTNQRSTLWRSDGTEAGTVAIAAFATTDSFAQPPQGFTPFRGALYFSAAGAEGQELWRTYGLVVGTALVADAVPGSAGSAVAGLTASADLLYFTARDEGGGELWRSDGTAGGTARVMDLRAGAYGSEPRDLFALPSGALLFTADLGDGARTLWRTEGTPDDTHLLRDFYPGAQGSRVQVLRVPGEAGAFIAARDDLGHAQLWTSDGTDAGTVPLSPEGCFGTVGLLDGAAFFSCLDAERGTEPWIHEGFAPSARMLQDVAVQSATSFVVGASEALGTLYFTVQRPNQNLELWRSDGTAEDTARVSASLPPSPWYFFAPPRVVGFDDTVYVSGWHPEFPWWQSDGTPWGTRGNSPLRSLGLPQEIDGKLYFITGDASSWGGILARLASSTSGAERLSPSAGLIPTLDGLPLVDGGGFVFFQAAAPSPCGLLSPWAYSRARGEAFPLLEGCDYEKRMAPTAFAPVARGGYFRMQGYESPWGALWFSDGTVAGTAPVPGPWEGRMYMPDGAMVSDGTGVIFRCALPDRWNEGLCVADEAGARVLWEPPLTSRRAATGAGPLGRVGGKWLFWASTSELGRELWVADGRDGPTRLLGDLAEGSTSSLPAAPAVVVTPDGTRAFFQAGDGLHGMELWVTDGSAEGTQRVLDLASGPASSFAQPVSVTGGRLYFLADDGVHGRQLWALRVESSADRTPPQLTCTDVVLEPRDVSQLRLTGAPVQAMDEAPLHPWVRYDRDVLAPFPLGVTAVQATASDAAGNEASCVFSVTVHDRMPPGLQCPLSVRVPAQGIDGATVDYPPALATDDSPPVALTYSHASGGTFPVGITELEVEARDAFGATSRCRFSVTVDPSLSPLVRCPASLVAEATSAEGASVSYAPATAVGTGPLELTYSQPSGSLFPLGTSQVRVEVRGSVEPVATCTFEIAVRDTQAPQLQCPASLQLQPGSDGTARADFEATAHDAASAVTLTYSLQPGSVLPAGSLTTVTVNAVDGAGNAADCHFTIGVEKAEGGCSATGAGAVPAALLLLLGTLRRRRVSRT